MLKINERADSTASCTHEIYHHRRKKRCAVFLSCVVYSSSPSLALHFKVLIIFRGQNNFPTDVFFSVRKRLFQTEKQVCVMTMSTYFQSSQLSTGPHESMLFPYVMDWPLFMGLSQTLIIHHKEKNHVQRWWCCNCLTMILIQFYLSVRWL